MSGANLGAVGVSKVAQTCWKQAVTVMNIDRGGGEDPRFLSCVSSFFRLDRYSCFLSWSSLSFPIVYSARMCTRVRECFAYPLLGGYM